MKYSVAPTILKWGLFAFILPDFRQNKFPWWVYVEMTILGNIIFMYTIWIGIVVLCLYFYVYTNCWNWFWYGVDFFQWSWRGVYWSHVVCPSIHLSLCPSVHLWTKWGLLCIFHNTHHIHFIFTHLVLLTGNKCIKHNLVNKSFQTWLLLAWQYRCQPNRSHVRKSLMTLILIVIQDPGEERVGAFISPKSDTCNSKATFWRIDLWLQSNPSHNASYWLITFHSVMLRTWPQENCSTLFRIMQICSP